MANEHVKARRGFFPVVAGNDVSIEQAGAAVLLSRSAMELTQAGGHVILSGGSTSIHQGGATLMASGGDVSISQGGAMVTAARSIRAERSYIGVAVTPRIEAADTTILVGSREAALIGAVAGAAIAVVGRLLRR